MAEVTFLRGGATHRDTVPDDTNLVVRAGVRKFPFPHLRYGCGMGKCGKCACRVVAGAEHLPEPGWKERKVLGDRLEGGMRLLCQVWIRHDITLAQDDPDASAAAARSAPCSSS